MSGLTNAPTDTEVAKSEAEKAAKVDTENITAHVKAEAYLIGSTHPHGHNNSH